jgi:hypothetical protein
VEGGGGRWVGGGWCLLQGEAQVHGGGGGKTGGNCCKGQARGGRRERRRERRAAASLARGRGRRGRSCLPVGRDVARAAGKGAGGRRSARCALQRGPVDFSPQRAAAAAAAPEAPKQAAAGVACNGGERRWGRLALAGGPLVKHGEGEGSRPFAAEVGHLGGSKSAGVYG